MEENRKYNIIYADPPWQYRVWKKKEAGRTAQSHYPTMDIPALSSLPISNLAAPDCALFLWVTFPLLFESYQLLQTWGFEYKTVAFVWVKLNRKLDSLFWGMGHWTRANAEFCLLATRGNPKRQSARVHQIILSHIQEHSRKPAETRDRIVQLMGDLPRIELFARESVPGWDVWGNEAPGSISLEPYQNLSKERK